MKITSCPTQEEIWEATKILDNQWAHVYQLLYSLGLASPYGNLLMVQRQRAVNFTSPLVRIFAPVLYEREYVPMKGLSFDVIGTEDEKEIIRKAKMLLEGRHLEKPHPQACCPYAKQISCVCAWAFDCELHGETHIGTHD